MESDHHGDEAVPMLPMADHRRFHATMCEPQIAGAPTSSLKKSLSRAIGSTVEDVRVSHLYITMLLARYIDIAKAGINCHTKICGESCNKQ